MANLLDLFRAGAFNSLNAELEATIGRYLRESEADLPVHDMNRDTNNVLEGVVGEMDSLEDRQTVALDYLEDHYWTPVFNVAMMQPNLTEHWQVKLVEMVEELTREEFWHIIQLVRRRCIILDARMRSLLMLFVD